MNSTHGPRDERGAVIAAAVLGAVVWFGVAASSLGAEAFDEESYFTIGLPIIGIGCAFLGYRVPVRAWRYGLVAMGSHAVLLLVVSIAGGNLSLLPIGLGLLALISLPMAAAGLAGARAYRKSLPPGHDSGSRTRDRGADPGARYGAGRDAHEHDR